MTLYKEHSALVCNEDYMADINNKEKEMAELWRIPQQNELCTLG